MRQRFFRRSAILAVAFLAGCAGGPGPVDSDAPKEFTTTPSGLKYRILRKSPSAKPKPTSTVKVNYRGWLDDGYEFDSSYERGQPAEFNLRGVISGWTEGVPLCPIGGMIELEIPPELGYGKGGSSNIPPDATLHFIIEVVDIITSS